MRWSNSNWIAFFDGDESSEVFDLSCWESDLDVRPLNFYRADFRFFDVVLEMIFVFVGSVVVRSSRMVVVCFSESLMERVSSANLRLERFVSGSYSARMTPWFSLFHIPVCGFITYCKKWVEQERAERVSLLGSSLEMEVFTLTSMLVLEICE